MFFHQKLFGWINRKILVTLDINGLILTLSHKEDFVFMKKKSRFSFQDA